MDNQADPKLPSDKPDPNLTTDKTIRLSVAQAITIGSVVLGTVMTIAYGIASFLQTRYIVDELKKTSEKIQNDMTALKGKNDSLSMRVEIKTSELATLIKENCKTGK